MDHPAARSSASSEAKGVRASTLLVGGFLDFLALLFCGLLFFAARVGDHFGDHFFPHFHHALVSLGTSSLGTVWPNIRGKGIEATRQPLQT
jgi:hypothetical protein